MTKDKAHWVLTAIFWLAKVIKAGRLMGFFTQWCDAAEKIEKHLKLNWTVGSEKWISVFHLCDSGPRSLLQSFFSPPLQLAERTNDKPDHPSRVRAGWQTAAAAAVTVKLQQYGSRMTVLWPWRDYIHHRGTGSWLVSCWRSQLFILHWAGHLSFYQPISLVIFPAPPTAERGTPLLPSRAWEIIKCILKKHLHNDDSQSNKDNSRAPNVSSHYS